MTPAARPHGIQVRIAERFTVIDLQQQVLRAGAPLEPFETPSAAGTPSPGEPTAATTFSIGAFTAAGMCVGAATFLPESPGDDRPTPLGVDALRPHALWRLRGMATAPDQRSSGIGAAVLAAGLAEVGGRGGLWVWCNARTAALAFYRRNGFEVLGEEFLTATGIPHRRAWRVVAVPTSGSPSS